MGGNVLLGSCPGLPEPYYRDDQVVLFHADCLELLPVISSAGWSAMITDPPYGIALKASRSSLFARWARSGTLIEGDASTNLGQAVIDHVRDELGRPVVAFASPRKPWAGSWRSLLVWDKGPAVGSGGDMKRSWKATWELIQVANNTPLRTGRDSAVLTCWTTSRNYRYHPTQKPLRLLAYLVRQVTDPGDTVFDPFAGSGTTLLAASRLGRRAIGIEVDERFCEAIAARLSGQADEPPESFPEPWVVPLPPV